MLKEPLSMIIGLWVYSDLKCILFGLITSTGTNLINYKKVEFQNYHVHGNL